MCVNASHEQHLLDLHAVSVLLRRGGRAGHGRTAPTTGVGVPAMRATDRASAVDTSVTEGTRQLTSRGMRAFLPVSIAPRTVVVFFVFKIQNEYKIRIIQNTASFSLSPGIVEPCKNWT